MEREKRTESSGGRASPTRTLRQATHPRISSDGSRLCVGAGVYVKPPTLIEAVQRPKRTEVERRKVPNAVGSGGRRVLCGVHERERVRRSELECESGVVSERVWTSGLPRFRVSQCATGNRSLGAENVDTLRQFCFAFFSFCLLAPSQDTTTHIYIYVFISHIYIYVYRHVHSEANELFSKCDCYVQTILFWMIQSKKSA